MHGCVEHKCSVQGPYNESHVLSCLTYKDAILDFVHVCVCSTQSKIWTPIRPKPQCHNAFYAHRNDIELKHKSYNVN